jgi:hypothetical protein
MGIAEAKSISTDRLTLFVVAAVLGLCGAIISPELLSSVGLMRGSLQHELELVRRTTYIEIEALRIIAVFLALVCGVLGVYWPRIAVSDRYRRFVSTDLRTPLAYARYQSSLFNISFLIVLAGTVLLAVYSIAAASFLGAETRVMINREDGVIEELSAVLLLVASALSLWVAWRVGRRDRRFPMHLFLAFLFFVMCGEEISWGQRYLGLETPEALAAVNVQGEINFHNMFGYFFDHMFIAAFFTWLVLAPLAAAYSRFFRRAFWTVGLPVGSLGLAAGAALVYLTFFVVLGRVVETIPGLRLAEPRELLSAICFLLLMAEVLVFVPASLRSKARTEDRSPAIATLRSGSN